MEIEVKEFAIEADGDLSVGIFPVKWSLTGSKFVFTDKEELSAFTNAVAVAFEEYLAESVSITPQYV